MSDLGPEIPQDRITEIQEALRSHFEKITHPAPNLIVQAQPEAYRRIYEPARDINRMEWQEKIEAAFMAEKYWEAIMLQMAYPDIQPNHALVQQKILETISNKPFRNWHESLKNIHICAPTFKFNAEGLETFKQLTHDHIMQYSTKQGENYHVLMGFIETTCPFLPDDYGLSILKTYILNEEFILDNNKRLALIKQLSAQHYPSLSKDAILKISMEERNVWKTLSIAGVLNIEITAELILEIIDIDPATHAPFILDSWHHQTFYEIPQEICTIIIRQMLAWPITEATVSQINHYLTPHTDALEFTQDQVDSIFSSFISHAMHNVSFDSFNTFFAEFDVKPSEKVVNTLYEEAIDLGDASVVLLIFGFSTINYPIDDKRAQAFFNRVVPTAKLSTIEKLEEIFGHPFKVDPVVIQKLYTEHIDGPIEILQNMSEVTQVPFDKEAVVAKYKQLCLEDIDVNTLIQLYDVSKVPFPSELSEGAQNLYASVADSDSPYAPYFRTLIYITHVRPSEQNLKRLFSNFLDDAQWYLSFNDKELLDSLGQRPSLEPTQLGKKILSVIETGQIELIGMVPVLLEYGTPSYDRVDIQGVYTRLAEPNAAVPALISFRTKKILRLTGEMPDIPALYNYLLFVHRTFIHAGTTEDTVTRTFFEATKRALGIELNDEIIQKIYVYLLSTKQYTRIEDFTFVTGIRPDIPVYLVQSELEQCAQEGKYSDILRLKMISSEVQCSNEVVQALYKKCFESPEFDSYSVFCDALITIEKFSNIKPELTDAQKTYALKQSLYSNVTMIQTISEIVGQKPEEESVIDHVYDAFPRLFEEREVLRLIDILRAFPCSFSQEVIHRTAYEALIQKDTRHSLLKKLAVNVFVLTGFELTFSHEEVENICRACLSRDMNIKVVLEWALEIIPPSQELSDMAHQAVWRPIEEAENDDTYELTPHQIAHRVATTYSLKDMLPSPSKETIQNLYFSILSNHSLAGMCLSLMSLYEATDTPPDMKIMTELSQKEGSKIPDLHARLGAIVMYIFEKHQEDQSVEHEFKRINMTEEFHKKTGMIAQISCLKRMFNLNFMDILSQTDVQSLYALHLLGLNSEATPALIKLLTRVLPSDEIVQKKYEKILDDFNFNSHSLEMIMKLSNILPSEKVVREVYKKFMDRYIDMHLNSGKYRRMGASISTDELLKQLLIIQDISKIPISIEEDDLTKLYVSCLYKGDKGIEILIAVSKLVNIDLDRDAIIRQVLKSESFERSRVRLEISKHQLDEHFADPGNWTLEELTRIYQIFQPYDYYLPIVESYEKQESKLFLLKLLPVIAIEERHNAENYLFIKSKILTLIQSGDRSLEKQSAEALSTLLMFGDGSIAEYMGNMVRDRKDERTDSGVRPDRFSTQQLSALRVLLGHSHRDAPRKTLIDLLIVSDVNRHIKRSILKKLAEDDEGDEDRIGVFKLFLPYDDGKPASLDWDDLKLYQAILEISSNRTREASETIAFAGYVAYTGIESHPEHIRATHYPDIPQSAFLQISFFVVKNPDLLSKFNSLYKMSKSSKEQDALLCEIATCAKGSWIREAVLAKLENIDFENHGMGKVTHLLKLLSVIIQLEDTIDESRLESINSKLRADSLPTLDKLDARLSQIATLLIQEIFPKGNVTPEKLTDLSNHWSTLEPLFTYAMKLKVGLADEFNDYGYSIDPDFSEALAFFTECVQHFDPPHYTEWKKWRYNMENGTVANQLSELNDEQRALWQKDHAFYLGETAISTSLEDSAQQVVSHIDSLVRNRHIFDADISKTDRHAFIQDTLSQSYQLFTSNPDLKCHIIDAEISWIVRDMQALDGIIRGSYAQRLHGAIEFLSGEGKHKVDKKLTDTIAFLEKFLTTDQINAIKQSLKNPQGQPLTEVDMEKVVSPDVLHHLQHELAEINRDYDHSTKSDIFEKYEFNRENTKSIGQFVKKRQELKMLLNFYRLMQINSKFISDNAMPPIEDKAEKSSEQVSTVIEQMKKYFSDNSTIMQDLSNIETALSVRHEVSLSRKLAILVSDDPELVMQCGKYPIGNESCQNYEGDVRYNCALSGYLADAHTRVIYLIDLEKLPSEVRQNIQEHGMEQVRSSIPNQTLLEATIARAIAKIAVHENGDPILFLEPTYQKIATDLDPYMNYFVNKLFCQPMNIPLYREAIAENLIVPASRNPRGQYEDGTNDPKDKRAVGVVTGEYIMMAAKVQLRS
ncbi:hypothetical protein KBC70_03930 [Candidatus Woesebacteria bacterium]|nr:hypothetical protein [Candidatus Woesebacteria bacterium]